VLGSRPTRSGDAKADLGSFKEAKDGRTLRLKFDRLKSDLEIVNKEKSVVSKNVSEFHESFEKSKLIFNLK
jgi:hypothetical protein